MIISDNKSSLPKNYTIKQKGTFGLADIPVKDSATAVDCKRQPTEGVNSGNALKETIKDQEVEPTGVSCCMCKKHESHVIEHENNGKRAI